MDPKLRRRFFEEKVDTDLIPRNPSLPFSEPLLSLLSGGGGLLKCFVTVPPAQRAGQAGGGSHGAWVNPRWLPVPRSFGMAPQGCSSLVPVRAPPQGCPSVLLCDSGPASPHQRSGGRWLRLTGGTSGSLPDHREGLVGLRRNHSFLPLTILPKRPHLRLGEHVTLTHIPWCPRMPGRTFSGPGADPYAPFDVSSVPEPHRSPGGRGLRLRGSPQLPTGISCVPPGPSGPSPQRRPQNVQKTRLPACEGPCLRLTGKTH